MEGKLLEGTKNALSGALTELDPKDSFNIIAFNGETYLFSSSTELATEETVEKAIEWMNLNFLAGGSTNISAPLSKVKSPFLFSDLFCKYTDIYAPVTDVNIMVYSIQRTESFKTVDFLVLFTI